MNGVSIIVCCYNSVKRLPETLKHLSKQNITKNYKCELILVDNGSTDTTSLVAKQLWEKYNINEIPLHIIYEQKTGLAHARERGIKEAQYEILIFCDDDNWLESNYVNGCYEILSTNNALAALGGVNHGEFENQTSPGWFNSFSASYAIGKQGDGDFQILEGRKYIVGAGIAVKKKAFEDIYIHGYNFFLTGRTGSKVIGGEDIELCYLLKLCGYQIAFSNRLQLKHYMPANRLTKKYLTNMFYSYPESWLVFEAYSVFLTNSYIPHCFKNSNWWKYYFAKKILSDCKEFPKYLYNKIKGNLNYYLFYETNVRFHIYGLTHVNKLTAMVNEIERVKTLKTLKTLKTKEQIAIDICEKNISF